MARRDIRTGRMATKEAAELLAISPKAMIRLRDRNVFTPLPRESANGSQSEQRRLYFLADEVYAYVEGGSAAVMRLRIQNGRELG